MMDILMYVANTCRWILLCGVLAVLLAGCDFCIGGNPGTPPGETAVMLTLEVGADTLSTRLANVVELDRSSSLGYRFMEPFRERNVSIRPDARRVLVERTLYEIPNMQGYAVDESSLPDSLNACTFTFDETKPLLCAVTGKGSAFNPVSGQNLSVDVARAYIGAFKDEMVQSLVADTARFFTADRYRIMHPEQAALSADGETLLVLMRQETRQVVTDATGAVVNDIVFASERRLLAISLANPESVVELSLDLLPEEGEAAQLSVSDDGAYVATAHEGTIRLASLADPNQITVLQGYHPQFAKGLLVFTPDLFGSGVLILQDLTSGEEDRIRTEDYMQSWSLHPESGRVYYATDSEVWYYDPSEEEHVLVYAFSQYLRQREAMNADFSVQGRDLFYVAPLPGQPDQIVIIGALTQYYLRTGEC